MTYFVVKKVNGFVQPVKDNLGDLALFNNKEVADLERIYLQPDHAEKLEVFESKLIGTLQ